MSTHIYLLIVVKEILKKNYVKYCNLLNLIWQDASNKLEDEQQLKDENQQLKTKVEEMVAQVSQEKTLYCLFSLF